MLIFDFFAGTGSATQAFEDAGHTVIKVELDKYFDAHERDIMTLSSESLLAKYGQPDFIWASPPCTAFSVASIGHHWNMDRSRVPYELSQEIATRPLTSTFNEMLG